MAKKSKRDPAIAELDQVITKIQKRANSLAKKHGVVNSAGDIAWDKIDAIGDKDFATGVAVASAVGLLGEIQRVRSLIAEEGYTAFTALRCLQIGDGSRMMESELFMAAGGGRLRGSYSVDPAKLEIMWQQRVARWRQTGKSADMPNIEWARENAPRKDGGTGVRTRGPVRNILIDLGLYPLKPI